MNKLLILSLPLIILALIFISQPSITSLFLGDVIQQGSTIITDEGISTPKIAEVRIVDPGNASDIQAKIDSCPSGCRIYIPAGNYTILIQ